MDHLFLAKAPHAVPLEIVYKDDINNWLKGQTARIQTWINSHLLKEPMGQVFKLPADEGHVERVIYISTPSADVWEDAGLIARLSQGVYALDDSFQTARAEQVFLASGLHQYRFERYKKSEAPFVQLLRRADVNHALLDDQLRAIYLARDLITTPANDMGPEELEAAVYAVAKKAGAKVSVIKGEKLLKQNYPAIYTVGKASVREPRLIDMTWGKPRDPKITLVGKGVCFDSGGLDIKPSSGMLTMKKDMGGAAFLLGLAQLIMAQKLPIRLRLLIPAVENSIDGNAYRPLDIIKMRSGKTVEVGNTDAEGRLVLADALYEADAEQPELIIDCATLTGAARIAMGSDVPALFSNRDELAKAMMSMSLEMNDPVWHLPIWKPYKASMKSKIADISSTGNGGYGGAIIAAIFLSEFLPQNTPWLHLDMMAYNASDRPGRPEGGEAAGMRAVFKFITQWDKIKAENLNND